MSESGVRPLRAALLVLLSAGALAACALLGARLGHPLFGGVAGYLVYLPIATHAFRTSLPGADQVVDDGRLPFGRRIATSTTGARGAG